MIKSKKDFNEKILIINKEPILAAYVDIPQMDAICQDFWGNAGKYSYNYYSSIISQNLSYVYKEKNGEVTAFCLVRYDSKKNQVGICLFCVKKNYQRKGLGKSLIQFCIDNCRKKGLDNFYLHTAVTNIPAINLYLLLGFRVVKTILNYYCNDAPPDNDAFLMILKNDNKIIDKNSKKMN